MIDYQALFKISYGLYIVCSGDERERSGYISNTVFQVTSEPPRFATCCNKDNLTCEMIEKTGCYTVSVLKQEASAGIIGNFGYKSGKDTDKFDGMDIQTGLTGAPVVMDESIAIMEIKVTESMDVGTHKIFIGELVRAEVLDDSEPLTYAYYRKIRKGVAPKNAPTYIDKSLLKAPD
jgi:flavin reductase (DIM6/NTAB) family NADH-FMN oxidoreductase RutF